VEAPVELLAASIASEQLALPVKPCGAPACAVRHTRLAATPTLRVLSPPGLLRAAAGVGHGRDLGQQEILDLPGETWLIASRILLVVADATAAVRAVVLSKGSGLDDPFVEGPPLLKADHDIVEVRGTPRFRWPVEIEAARDRSTTANPPRDDSLCASSPLCAIHAEPPACKSPLEAGVTPVRRQRRGSGKLTRIRTGRPATGVAGSASGGSLRPERSL
jgi:hypothetical protein